MHLLSPGQSIPGTSRKDGVPVFKLILQSRRLGAGPGVSATWNQSSLGHSILEPVTMLLPSVHNIRRWLSSESTFTKRMREAHDKMNTDTWNQMDARVSIGKTVLTLWVRIIWVIS